MNIAIVNVIVQSFCQPHMDYLQSGEFETGLEKFTAARNLALDEGNEEVVEMLDWIETRDLVETFFQ